MKCKYNQEHETCEHKSGKYWCNYRSHTMLNVDPLYFVNDICTVEIHELEDDLKCRQCGRWYPEGTHKCPWCNEMFIEEEAARSAIGRGN